MTGSSFPTVHASGHLYGHLFDHQCREQLSVAYVHAVTTAARCALEEIKVDYQTVDATINQTAPHQFYDKSKLDVQLKCTSRDILKSDHVAYSLEEKYYDELRSTRRYNPIILIVLIVPPTLEEWLVQEEEGLRLHRAAYWMSLRGEPEIDRRSTTVHIPRSNIFNVEQLLDIMTRIGNGGMP